MGFLSSCESLSVCIRFPGSSAGKKSICYAKKPCLIPGGRDPWRDELHSSVLGFRGGSDANELGKPVLDPGLGRFPAEGATHI